MTEEAVRPGRRQRSLHCKPAEQAMIRERAAAAEKTVSRRNLEYETRRLRKDLEAAERLKDTISMLSPPAASRVTS